MCFLDAQFRKIVFYSVHISAHEHISYPSVLMCSGCWLRWLLISFVSVRTIGGTWNCNGIASQHTCSVLRAQNWFRLQFNSGDNEFSSFWCKIEDSLCIFGIFLSSSAHRRMDEIPHSVQLFTKIFLLIWWYDWNIKSPNYNKKESVVSECDNAQL